ncbi:unnamed protein product, partial [Effrenium voratum]
VIWHTVSSADQLGLAAQPLLTLYRASGDVYRVMFRITRRFGESRLISKSVGQCQVCGAYVGPFEEDALYGTPARRPRCCGSDALVCWGPLWMGGLHSDEFIHELQQDASDRGWLDDETPIPGTDSLGDLLAKLLSEARAEAAAQASGEALAPWTLRVRELARRAKSSPPKLKALMEDRAKRGTGADWRACQTVAQNRACHTRPTRSAQELSSLGHVFQTKTMSSDENMDVGTSAG